MQRGKLFVFYTILHNYAMIHAHQTKKILKTVTLFEQISE